MIRQALYTLSRDIAGLIWSLVWAIWRTDQWIEDLWS